MNESVPVLPLQARLIQQSSLSETPPYLRIALIHNPSATILSKNRGEKWEEGEDLKEREGGGKENPRIGGETENAEREDESVTFRRWASRPHPFALFLLTFATAFNGTGTTVLGRCLTMTNLPLRSPRQGSFRQFHYTRRRGAVKFVTILTIIPLIDTTPFDARNPDGAVRLRSNRSSGGDAVNKVRLGRAFMVIKGNKVPDGGLTLLTRFAVDAPNAVASTRSLESLCSEKDREGH
ncbi:hypothetical protein BHE74_00045646 [Ensete ventricosum]|nr:hypothetical protein GW17_00023968 [Ensete ventricosum]RWW48301.1 hypothetical protein BHE74_00045646 [Ensete ventricosum]